MTTATVDRATTPSRPYRRHRRDPLTAALPPVLPQGMDLNLLGGEIESWRDAALCAQVDPNTFFPGKGRANATAKRVCRACPVQQACLDHALRHGEHHGVWGGKSARERARMVTELGLPYVPSPRYFPVEQPAHRRESTPTPTPDLTGDPAA